MKKTLILLAVLCMFISCSEKRGEHFLTDKKYRATVHEQFLKTKELASNRSKELFSIFETNLTTEQTEALEFLYAYMPLSDLVDYDADFFLKQVNTALQARDTFSWGRNVPEEIFRHFVLVYRVNNENLDTARVLFFNELKDRIKTMSMYDAALEVNHWCHEKVCYKSSDGRTSAPLATLCTSWGRCGEESTFTVTAMRAVGIPARQCYTPRWAHTDDNHAWVEVWIDGQWYYLGACEPEPKLNVAWFTAPAKRAMMVHTTVFGAYNGAETKNFKNDLYSKINVLENYTSTKTLWVKVVDEKGNAVENATVKYKLYNYSELFSLADLTTNKQGLSSLVTGFGDLVIWASKDDKYGYSKANIKETDTLTLALNHVAGKEYEELMVLTPPVVQEIETLTEEELAKNNQRLAHEDSIRNEYMSTFITKEQANNIAKKLNLNAEEVFKYLQLSQGNHKQISQFIEKYAIEEHLFAFLSSLSVKDLRDTPFDILDDHFKCVTKFLNKEIINIEDEMLVKYIYSPRIHLELIRPWRSFLQSKFDQHFVQQIQYNPQIVANWINKNIKLNTERNYYYCPISPVGTYQLKQADVVSRNILFVAICRSFAIPARIEAATEKPQYFSKNKWVDVLFEKQEAAERQKTMLTLQNDKLNIVKPEYWIHYTLASFKDGDFITLDYEDDELLKEFPAKLPLQPGYYRLLTGNRASDGTVFTKTNYFEIKRGETKELTISLAPIKLENEVLGKIDLNLKVKLMDGTEKSLSQLQNKKGMVLAILDPQKEPTRHIMNDIPLSKKDFENWGGGMLFLVPDDKITKDFNASNYKNLPKQAGFSIDTKRDLLNKIVSAMTVSFDNTFPFIVFITSKGEIIFSSKGYKIGINEDLMKVIHSL